MNSNRILHFGPLMLEMESEDFADVGYDPETEKCRIVTRTPEHAAARKGSLVSLQMDVDQLRQLVVQAANLVRMIDEGRTPGDRPVSDIPIELPAPGAVKES